MSAAAIKFTKFLFQISRNLLLTDIPLAW